MSEPKKYVCEICHEPLTISRGMAVSQTPNGPKVTCDPKYGDRMHRAESVGEPPLCADCNHPRDDSRFHFEAPGDNWGAALHHFRPKGAEPPRAPGIQKNRSTPASSAHWDFVEETAKKVEAMPEWKQNAITSRPSAPAPPMNVLGRDMGTETKSATELMNGCAPAPSGEPTEQDAFRERVIQDLVRTRVIAESSPVDLQPSELMLTKWAERLATYWPDSAWNREHHWEKHDKYEDRVKFYKSELAAFAAAVKEGR